MFGNFNMGGRAREVDFAVAEWVRYGTFRWFRYGKRINKAGFVK